MVRTIVTYVIFAQVTVSVLIMLQLTQAVVGQTASTGFLVSLKLKIYLFKLTNIFVQIVKFFFKLSNIFVQIVKYICPMCKIYFSWQAVAAKLIIGSKRFFLLTGFFQKSLCDTTFVSNSESFPGYKSTLEIWTRVLESFRGHKLESDHHWCHQNLYLWFQLNPHFSNAMHLPLRHLKFEIWSMIPIWNCFHLNKLCIKVQNAADTVLCQDAERSWHRTLYGQR